MDIQVVSCSKKCYSECEGTFKFLNLMFSFTLEKYPEVELMDHMLIVQSLSHVQSFVTPWTPACQASLSFRVCSNSCPLSQWCQPTISPSATSFSSCLQSFPGLGSFSMSQFFTSGGQSTGASVSKSVLPMNIPDWFPLGWAGWISLQSKGLSRVFSNTTVQKHQFFGAQLSL